MKRPALLFFPKDWRSDLGLQLCSLAAQGLWINMLCLMHEGEPYGHLAINGEVIQPVNLAGILGEDPKQVERLIEELQRHGVPSYTPEGVLFSRRLVRDEKTRQIKSQAGKMGGNPALLDKQKVNQPDKQKNKQRGLSPLANANANVSSSEGGTGGGEWEKDFDLFWAAYPKHTGKKVSREWWQKHKPPVEKLVMAVRRQKAAKDIQRQREGWAPDWKDPIRWLKGDHWMDEVDPDPPPPGPGGGTSALSPEMRARLNQGGSHE